MDDDFISEEDANLVRDAMATALIGVAATDHDDYGAPAAPHIWVVVDEFLDPHGFERLEMDLRASFEIDLESHRYQDGQLDDNRDSRFLQHMLKALDEWEAAERARDQSPSESTRRILDLERHQSALEKALRATSEDIQD